MDENLPNTLSYDVQLPEDDPTFPFSMFKLVATDMFGNTAIDYGDNYFYMQNVQNMQNSPNAETWDPPGRTPGQMMVHQGKTMAFTRAKPRHSPGHGPSTV